MDRPELPSDFLFGTATAAYQVEGATHEGGRTECIWEEFARIPGKVYCGENGDIGADQYHRYQEDVALMAKLGFGAYRFSVSWSRVLPHGGTIVNEEGIQYYRDLCDELHAKGLKAYCTIYHWDLPVELQRKGGWANREIAYAFRDYAKVLYRELGDKVDCWITLNEPFCFLFLGYGNGAHAPGIADMDQFIRGVHYANLAHGLAVQAYRETGLKAPIGITWNPMLPRPATKRPKDIEAALHSRMIRSDIYIGPVFGHGYPEYVTETLGWKLPIEKGDMEIISSPIDFYAVNWYNERVVEANPEAPNGIGDAPNWEVETSSMHWPVNEMGLLRILRWLNEYSNGLPCIVSETGAAVVDVLENDGRVRDLERIDYYGKQLKICEKAIKEGIPLKGFFCWSFIDNYEWAYGYTQRFGIVYCDYHTLKRYPKDSAYYLRDIMAGYGDY